MALLKEQRGTLILGLVCVLGGALLDLAPAAFIKWAVDAIADGNTYQAGMMAIWIIALYSVKYFFTRGQILYLNMAAHRVTANLRQQLFRKLQSLPIAYFNATRTGAIQSVITNDVAVIQTGVPLVKDVMSAPVRAIGGLLLLGYLNWKLAAVSLLALPIIAVAIVRTSRRVRQSQKEVQENLSDMTATMQESLNAVRIVRAFSAEERQSSRFATDIEATYNSNMRVVNRMATLKPLIEVIGAGAIALIMYLGAKFVADGTMTAGDLFSFVYLLDVIKNGATGIGNISSVYSQVNAATDHIYQEVFDVETDVPDDANAVTLDDPKGRIEFENVSFSYPDGTPALHNISLTIDPGESVALVGRSGAGKSTIADLLLRFYDPTEGRITFDGVDLRRLDSKWLRRQIGVVPQQTLLFAGSLLDNIRFGKPEASAEEVRAAAYSAHADEFISEMPDDYHTFVGEKGVRLSGGEMQRIAIARALIIDPRVMLLDEATSALDSISEQHVQKALDDITVGRATLLIAHRLSTASRADKIIVLSRGHIVEKGSHVFLNEMNGTYAGMYRAFSAGLIDGNL
ncbi:MAG: ABC transporter ATP-binding protein/permease [Armatimonadota bacterium]|nr:ABC transporter ATP-binding protein/permease [Armatimonadota bacterium]